MPRFLTCAHGHQWPEPLASEEPSEERTARNCPVCGAGAESISAPLAESQSALGQETRAVENRADDLASTLPVPASKPAPGTPAGAANVRGYEILRELGRGGMGVVYLARQMSLNRIVALKMILAGTYAGPRTLARFRAEAEAVARLQHPNIVQIYEVGEQDGCPYFSLEFVNGGSLSNRLAHKPQAPPDSAALVGTLARAMHAAHQRGIVHRDLKPGNVLLQMRDGERPEKKPGRGSVSLALMPLSSFNPKIADFGLAKRLDETSQTVTGDLLGTPSYMAPEQAGGHARAVGPSADVYALGAILYEMLTGRPPFQGQTAFDTVRQVIGAEPVPPMRLEPRIPLDLQTICLKCLEKTPTKRYASAGALADDLEHFLSGRPISARPVGQTERAWKWARRRPLVASLLAFCAGVSAVLLGVIVWSNFELRAAAGREKQRAEEAELASRRAQHNFDRAILAVDQMLTEVSEEALIHEPRLVEKRRALLEKALVFYQEFLEEKSDDAEVRFKTGLAYKRMADILRYLGRHEPAQNAYQQAIQILEETRANSAGPEEEHHLAEAYNWYGESLRSTGQLSLAEEAYRKALELQTGLSAAYPGTPLYRKDMARTYTNLGLLAQSTNRFEDAFKGFDEGIRLLEGLLRLHGMDWTVRHELARVYLDLARLEAGNRHPSEATQLNTKAIDLLKQLATEFPRNPEFRHERAIVHNNQGNLCGRERRYMEARAEHGNALTLFEDLVKDFPTVPEYEKELANTQNSLGAVLLRSKEYERGAECFKDAARRFEKLAADHADVPDYVAGAGVAVGNLGRLHYEQGDFSKAKPELRAAISLLEKALAGNQSNPVYRSILRNRYEDLAETLVRSRNHVQAAEAADRLAQVWGDRSQDYYQAARFLARCVTLVEGDSGMAEGGRRQAADRYATRSLALLQKAVQQEPAMLEQASQQIDFQALRARADFQKLLAKDKISAKP